jgi:hypothetical protein
MAGEKDTPAHGIHAHLSEWMQSMDEPRVESPHMAAEVDGDLARALEVLKVVLPLPEEYDVMRWFRS